MLVYRICNKNQELLTLLTSEAHNGVNAGTITCDFSEYEKALDRRDGRKKARIAGKPA
jgi:hypothetical protein